MSVSKHDIKSITIAREIYEERYDICIKEIDNYEKNKSKLQDLRKIFGDYLEAPRWKGLAPCCELAYVNGANVTTEFHVKQGDFNVLATPERTIKYLEDTIEEMNKLHSGYSNEAAQLRHRIEFLGALNNTEDLLVEHSRGLVMYKNPYVDIIEFEDEPVDPFRRLRVSHCFTQEEKLKYIAKRMETNT